MFRKTQFPPLNANNMNPLEMIMFPKTLIPKPLNANNINPSEIIMFLKTLNTKDQLQSFWTSSCSLKP